MCIYECIFFGYTALDKPRGWPNSSGNLPPPQLPVLRTVVPHQWSHTRAQSLHGQKTNHLYVFQPWPTARAQPCKLLSFSRRRSPLPKQDFFFSYSPSFINLLMCKINSDRVILVPSEQAHDVQKPFKCGLHLLWTVPSSSVCSSSPGRSEYPLPGARVTHGQLFPAWDLSSIFLCPRKPLQPSDGVRATLSGSRGFLFTALIITAATFCAGGDFCMDTRLPHWTLSSTSMRPCPSWSPSYPLLFSLSWGGNLIHLDYMMTVRIQPNDPCFVLLCHFFPWNLWFTDDRSQEWLYLKYRFSVKYLNTMCLVNRRETLMK